MPAITQENGQLACTTAITRRYFYNQEDLEAGRNPYGMRIFTGMNSNVQRYFDQSKFLSGRYPSIKSVGPAINLPSHGLNNGSISDITSTLKITETEEVLVFPTPFAHKPSWNAINLDDYRGYNLSMEKPCPGVFDHTIADYGYVPQAFIEFITQKFPKITSRFSPGAIFPPGGPSILDGIEVLIAAPATLDPAEDLTVSTAFTVTNTGCFHPDVCLANDDASNIVITTTVSTAQSLVQRPNSREAIPTQASKTTFLASLANTQRETSTLKSSTVASQASVASPAESAHPPDEAKITTTGEVPITTKAAALHRQSPSNLVLQNPESHLLLASVTSSAEMAYSAGEAPVTTKVAAIPPQSPSSIVLLNLESHLLLASVASLAETANPASEASKTAKAAAVSPKSLPSVVLLNPESHLPLASATSSAETTHLVGETPITAKLAVLPLPSLSSVVLLNSKSYLLLASLASSAGTTYAAGGAPIITKAAALPPQSPSSLVLQDPESYLLLRLERVVHKSFAGSLLPSVGSSQLTAYAPPKVILNGQTFLSIADSPTAISETTSDLAPQVSALVINYGMTSKLPGHPGPVIKIG